MIKQMSLHASSPIMLAIKALISLFVFPLVAMFLPLSSVFAQGSFKFHPAQ
jgi:hypothetical protein